MKRAGIIALFVATGTLSYGQNPPILFTAKTSNPVEYVQVQIPVESVAALDGVPISVPDKVFTHTWADFVRVTRSGYQGILIGCNVKRILLVLVGIVVLSLNTHAQHKVIVSDSPQEVWELTRIDKNFGLSNRFVLLDSSDFESQGFGKIEVYLDRRIFIRSGFEIMEAFYKDIEAAFLEGKNTVLIPHEKLTGELRAALSDYFSGHPEFNGIFETDNFALEFSTRLTANFSVDGVPIEADYLDLPMIRDEVLPRFEPSSSASSSQKAIVKELVSPTARLVSLPLPDLVTSMRVEAEALRLAAEYAAVKQSKQLMMMTRLASSIDADRFRVGEIPNGGMSDGIPQEFMKALWQSNKIVKGTRPTHILLTGYSAHFGFAMTINSGSVPKRFYIELPF